MVFATYIFVVDYKLKLPEVPKKTRNWIVGLFVLSIYGFFSVTREGKPLYGAYNKNFFEAIPLDYFSRFIEELDFVSVYVMWITFFLVFFIILMVFLINKEKSPIGIITLGMFTAIVTFA